MPSFERLGPYIIERSLGSGGMGAVFLGVDETTGERAAVKVLSPALGEDPNFRERFGTEIETLKKLRHPNIVQLLGFGEQDGQLFYAMEMVEGRTLQQEMQAGRTFQWREVARIGVQICQALKHAHDRGVIHRDLKPANLLYTVEEQIKLADFGIAKLYGMSQLTVAGGVIGTADYMSPEQGEGKAVTARSDLYSLGSVLFALLARRPPFASRTAAEVMHKLRYEEAPPIRRLAPETPQEFELIIAQLLAKEPGDRIATALAVANRLKAMDHALSMETRVASDSDEFDLSHDEQYQLSDESPTGQSPTMETRAVTPLDRVTNLADEDLLQQHRKETVAMPGLGLSEPTPLTTTETHSTHFTTFDEAARRRATTFLSSEDTTPLWLKVAPLLLAVGLIAVGIWYFSRPASADSLYEEIIMAAEEGETADLIKVESEIDEYLERFPGTSRHQEVQQLRDELDNYRLQRRYERKARTRSRHKDLGPVERAYVNATRLAATDPVAAAQQLQAILDVYSEAELGDEDARCVDLAREQLDHLQADGREMFDTDLAAINQRLDAADALGVDQAERAQAIRRGVIALYGSLAWAQPAVQRARAALDQGDLTESPSRN